MYKKVGIPRGLFYYKYFPLWKTFLEELGAEILVSEATNKRILDDGVKTCVDEACLPVKLFHGHVLNLVGRVDCLFIPRLTSISPNEYICPQIGGLPDTVRNTIKDIPPIIGTEVNLRKNKMNAWKAALETGKHFTSNRKVIENAFSEAIQNYRDYRGQIIKGMVPSDKSVEQNIRNDETGKAKLKIAVLGHAYNLYDNYINMNMIQKLQKFGAEVITNDMVDESVINQNVRSLQKPMFWNFGRKAIGSAMHFAGDLEVDGIIYVMSFGCGIDSFVCDLVERKLRRNSDVPFILITIDEHSGEAGLNTRLEAFIDMIEWRKRNENNFSSFG
jgi:Uncharacterized protein conserved in bacteria